MKHRGPRTIYRPKSAPAVTLFLTAKGKQRLVATATRVGQSKSNIVEHLLRKYAGTVTAIEVGDYTPRSRPSVSVSLTRLAKQVLAAVADRTDKSGSEIVERLLERYAATVGRQEFREDEAA